jgi:hypothetical protein
MSQIGGSATSCSNSCDPSEGPEELLQVDILYCQILYEAFGKLKNELCLTHLKFNTRSFVQKSVSPHQLSDSSDIVRHANQIVSDLHAVL